MDFKESIYYVHGEKELSFAFLDKCVKISKKKVELILGKV